MNESGSGKGIGGAVTSMGKGWGLPLTCGVDALRRFGSGLRGVADPGLDRLSGLDFMTGLLDFQTGLLAFWTGLCGLSDLPGVTFGAILGFNSTFLGPKVRIFHRLDF